MYRFGRGFYRKPGMLFLFPFGLFLLPIGITAILSIIGLAGSVVFSILGAMLELAFFLFPGLFAIILFVIIFKALKGDKRRNEDCKACSRMRKFYEDDAEELARKYENRL